MRGLTTGSRAVSWIRVAVVGVCCALGRPAFAASEFAERLPAPFGEQPRFSASSLPKAFAFSAFGYDFGVDFDAVPVEDIDAGSPRPAAAVVRAAAVGSVSDIGLYLRARSPLVESADLVSRGSFANLTPFVRQPLKSDHAARTAERDAMLPPADSIDDLYNNRLEPWKKRLDANLEKLEADTVPYTDAANIFRSKCMPARDEATWKWCQEEENRLGVWRGKLVKRGDEHNAKLAKFHTESKPYDARLAALGAKIESWISAVDALIGRIKQAIWTSTGTCSVEEFDRLDNAITELCKRAKWACTEEQTCTELRVNLRAGQACYDARKAMMDRCFGGGDGAHHGVLRQVQNGIDRCQRIYRQKCEGAGAAGGSQ